MIEDAPLPVSKHVRVILEVVRTIAACGALTVNCLVLLRVFGVL